MPTERPTALILRGRDTRAICEPRLSHNSDKFIPSDQAVNKIANSRATYVELDRVAMLDMRLISALRQRRVLGLPLYVNVEGVNEGNDVLTRRRVSRFLSHLDCVNGVVTVLPDSSDFTLNNHALSLHSNTSFLGDELYQVTHERVNGKDSLYDQKVSEVNISNRKYTPLEELTQVIEQYQQYGLRVVILAGVYDIIHPGHVEFIEKASEQGDVLIILTNSDYSVKRNPKGANGDRPIHPLIERVETLAAVDVVTHVSSFDSDNIAPLFEGVHNITYVKSSKDAASPSPGVRLEMSLAEENGGKNVIIPSVKHDIRPEFMSSSGIIETVHSGSHKYDFLSREFLNQPESVQQKIADVVLAVDQWNIKTNNVTNWLDILKNKSTISVEAAVETEKRVIKDIAMNFDNIVHEIGYERDYLHYIIPLVLGMMVGLDIKWMPVQYNISENKYEIINFAKLSDGELEFFNLRTNELQDPFKFEDFYWRPFPTQYNFITQEGKKPFAKRLYLYTEEQQDIALGLKILFEEAKEEQNPVRKQKYEQEFRALTRSIWETIVGEPFSLPKIENSGQMLSHELPNIVAHGGTALLDVAGGFPENSRAGLKEALNKGIDILEIDIVPTKDGKWIVSHDIILDVATASSGLTLDKTQQELQSISIRTAQGDVSSENLMSLEESLSFIASHTKLLGQEPTVKIDIKASTDEAERNLITTLRRSKIPLGNFIVTAGESGISNRLHNLDPELSFELNTVEVINYLMAYKLMDENIMPELFLEYVQHYAPTINAKAVSLMLVAMKYWGRNVFHRVNTGITDMGLQTFVWEARSLDDYLLAASVGATNVMVQDPQVVGNILEFKQGYQS